MSVVSPMLVGSAIHDQHNLRSSRRASLSSIDHSKHAETPRTVQDLSVQEFQSHSSSEDASAAAQDITTPVCKEPSHPVADDEATYSAPQDEQPEHADHEPQYLYDNSMPADQPLTIRGIHSLRGRGNGRSRGNARSRRVPPSQLQPLQVMNQDSQQMPPMILQHGPGRPPYGSPTILKAACSPLSQKSSLVSSPYHEEMFDTMSPHSTVGSMSPGHVHGYTYGRPASSSGSKGRGAHLRTSSRARGPNLDMPFQQHSPAPSVGRQSPSFMPLHDGRLMIEPMVPQLTGYSLVASRLAANYPDELRSSIQPLYRRFRDLTHRMLLHLQDEISQLEEQLHTLDDISTRHRQTFSGQVSPESRRAEENVNGDFYRRRTDLLGQIGFKLELYNNLLRSFKATQAMPSARMEDIQDYRAFLDAEMPIDEAETGFLDHVDDLLCLAPCGASTRCDEDVSSTPVQGNGRVPSYTAERGTGTSKKRPKADSSSTSRQSDEVPSTQELPAALGAVSVSVLVPLLAFLIVPGFLGRLIVSLVVGLGVGVALVGSRHVALPQAPQAAMLFAFYGAAMSVLAGVVA